MGQISEQQVQQLMKLRELMMADMSSKQSYQAAMIQKQAVGEAATEQFFKWTPELSKLWPSTPAAPPLALQHSYANASISLRYTLSYRAWKRRLGDSFGLSCNAVCNF
jgi:hypothetical protein